MTHHHSPPPRAPVPTPLPLPSSSPIHHNAKDQTDAKASPTEVSYTAYSPSPESIDLYYRRHQRITHWTRDVLPEPNTPDLPAPAAIPKGKSVGVGSARWSDVSNLTERVPSSQPILDPIEPIKPTEPVITVTPPEPRIVTSRRPGRVLSYREPPVPLLAQAPSTQLVPPKNTQRHSHCLTSQQDLTPSPMQLPAALPGPGSTRSEREAYIASALSLPFDMLSQRADGSAPPTPSSPHPVAVHASTARVSPPKQSRVRSIFVKARAGLGGGPGRSERIDGSAQAHSAPNHSRHGIDGMASRIASPLVSAASKPLPYKMGHAEAATLPKTNIHVTPLPAPTPTAQSHPHAARQSFLSTESAPDAARHPLPLSTVAPSLAPSCPRPQQSIIGLSHPRELCPAQLSQEPNDHSPRGVFYRETSYHAPSPSPSHHTHKLSGNSFGIADRVASMPLPSTTRSTSFRDGSRGVVESAAATVEPSLHLVESNPHCALVPSLASVNEASRQLLSPTMLVSPSEATRTHLRLPPSTRASHTTIAQASRLPLPASATTTSNRTVSAPPLAATAASAAPTISAASSAPAHRQHLPLLRPALTQSPASFDSISRSIEGRHRELSSASVTPQTRFEPAMYPLPPSEPPGQSRARGEALPTLDESHVQGGRHSPAQQPELSLPSQELELPSPPRPSGSDELTRLVFTSSSAQVESLREADDHVSFEVPSGSRGRLRVSLAWLPSRRRAGSQVSTSSDVRAPRLPPKPPTTSRAPVIVPIPQPTQPHPAAQVPAPTLFTRQQPELKMPFDREPLPRKTPAALWYGPGQTSQPPLLSPYGPTMPQVYQVAQVPPIFAYPQPLNHWATYQAGQPQTLAQPLPRQLSPPPSSPLRSPSTNPPSTPRNPSPPIGLEPTGYAATRLGLGDPLNGINPYTQPYTQPFYPSYPPMNRWRKFWAPVKQREMDSPEAGAKDHSTIRDWRRKVHSGRAPPITHTVAPTVLPGTTSHRVATLTPRLQPPLPPPRPIIPGRGPVRIKPLSMWDRLMLRPTEEQYERWAASRRERGNRVGIGAGSSNGHGYGGGRELAQRAREKKAERETREQAKADRRTKRAAKRDERFREGQVRRRDRDRGREGERERGYHESSLHRSNVGPEPKQPRIPPPMQRTKTTRATAVATQWRDHRLPDARKERDNGERAERERNEYGWAGRWLGKMKK